MKARRIAVIAGDGIGREAMPEGLRVLQAAATRYQLPLRFDEFGWSCDYYLKHGRMDARPSSPTPSLPFTT